MENPMEQVQLLGQYIMVGNNDMYSRKIYLRWSQFHQHYAPSGMNTNEDIRRIPKQGYGVCEIAAWLSDDIQYSINSIDIWIRNFSDFIEGKLADGCFGMGNAHWVLAVQDKVFIGCEYVIEQQVILTIEQILYVLEQYRQFLEADYTNPQIQLEPIDVEYIAEGDVAVKLYESLEGSYGMPY